MNFPLRHRVVPSPQSGDTRIQLLRWFLTQHGEALAQAADLLGGPRAEGRARRLAGAAARAPRLSPALLRELEALHALLALEHVADPEGEEAAFFAATDPSSPLVEDLCALTDELAGLLRELARLAGEEGASSTERLAASRAA